MIRASPEGREWRYNVTGTILHAEAAFCGFPNQGYRAPSCAPGAEGVLRFRVAKGFGLEAFGLGHRVHGFRAVRMAFHAWNF